MSSGDEYYATLFDMIKTGIRIDPDLWCNNTTGNVELRPGSPEERRKQAILEGWVPNESK